ncbi:MAG: hypothetical protein ACYC8T_33610, partial [Myxococcaceae bacterium]
AGLILGFGLLFIYSDQLIYASVSEPRAKLTGLLLLVPMAAALLFVGARFLDKRWGRGVVLALIASLAGLLIGARIYTLYASPSPHIDVFTTSRQAVEFFLQGKNPYAQSYVDIYGGAYDYAPAFPYWPGYLLWASGWAKVLGGAHDVRASLLIAEVLCAAVFAGWMRRLRFSWPVAALGAALWLSFPIDLFVLEQAWIDPLLVLGFAAAGWAATARRWALTGVFLGFACATKQYAFIGALFLAVWVLRTHGWRPAVRGLVGGAATFFVLMLPFALVDWTSFYRSSIEQWASAQPRLDSLAFAAWAVREVSLDPAAAPGVYRYFTVATLVVLGALLGWTAARRDRTLTEALTAMAVTYGWVLLFAKQSFCNYYYFLSFFIAAAAMLRAADLASPAEPAAPAAAPPA